jgi:hypothetical protein
MDWIQFIIFSGGVFGCFFWNRSESRADIRHMDAKLESNRELVREVHKESTAMISAIEKEIRDFHRSLQKQDADFKSHLLHLQEERRK